MAAEHSDCGVAMNRISHFKNNLERFERQLERIDDIPRYLHTMHLSVSSYRQYLVKLVENVVVKRNFSSLRFFRCMPDTNYISQKAQLFKDQVFLSDIIKIHRNTPDILKEPENEASANCFTKLEKRIAISSKFLIFVTYTAYSFIE